MKIKDEREGQRLFFESYKRYIPDFKDKELNDILEICPCSDGIIGGNILEFKKTINNLNTTLFQAIKYLSKMRINGQSVPKNILLIDLIQDTVYKFNSNDFLDDIEKLYIGASSKNNNNFLNINNIEPERIFFNTDSGKSRLIEILRTKEYTKIHIDENCILGWAKRFYNTYPNSSKGSFIGSDDDLFKSIGEIRVPCCFKDFIYPYEEKTNEKFKYLMDVLNDKKRKKETGAFYTPLPYCQKAIELVRIAIKNVPSGNDYIILDRCAGTGNLEICLTEDELSHCVLSTYECYEYKVLIERLGDKVRYIIPPIENDIKFRDGFIVNADALSRDYIKNEYLQNIINDPKITIILFENPPYRDMTTNSNGTAKKGFTNFVKMEMSKSVKGAILNDLSNLFIYSGFKYYLRQPTDSYILFSPVKYFKSCNLCNKTFINGYLFNRKHFHASPSSISCILWQNIDKKHEEFNLQIYDIILNKNIEDIQEQVNQGKLEYIKNICIRKVYRLFSEMYFDKRKNSNYIANINLSGFNLDSNSVGLTRTREEIKGHGSCFYLYNDIAYLRASSFNLDNNSVTLTTIPVGAEAYSPHGKMISKDNYISKLPLFCAKLFPQENWYEKDVYFTTADKGEEYLKDIDLLKSCLIYTCLCRQNKCISFNNNDGKFYRNELCFYQNTVADSDLKNFVLNDYEENLFKIWKNILDKAQKTKNYKSKFTYGLYQVDTELNTCFKYDKNGNKVFSNEENYRKIKEKVNYEYIELNTEIDSLRGQLKYYYKDYIQDKLFKYELLK